MEHLCSVLAGPMPLHDHVAVFQVTIELEQQPTVVDPGLVPLVVRGIVDVEALPRVGTLALALFEKDAAAEDRRDAVRPHDLFLSVGDLPGPELEVELMMGFVRARTLLGLLAPRVSRNQE